MMLFVIRCLRLVESDMASNIERRMENANEGKDNIKPPGIYIN